MLYLAIFSGLVSVVIMLQCGAIKIALFHKGIFKDIRSLRLKRINRALIHANNANDKKELQRLKAWHVAGLVSMYVGLLSFLTWLMLEVIRLH